MSLTPMDEGTARFLGARAWKGGEQLLAETPRWRWFRRWRIRRAVRRLKALDL